MAKLPTIEEALGYKLEVQMRVRHLIDAASTSHEIEIQKIVEQKKLQKTME